MPTPVSEDAKKVLHEVGLREYETRAYLTLLERGAMTASEVSEYGAKAQFVSYEKSEHPSISWLKGTSDVELLLSDGTKKVGISSNQINNENGMVRFSGIGYANFDNEKGKFVFSYE